MWSLNRGTARRAAFKPGRPFGGRRMILSRICAWMSMALRTSALSARGSSSHASACVSIAFICSGVTTRRRRCPLSVTARPAAARNTAPASRAAAIASEGGLPTPRRRENEADDHESDEANDHPVDQRNRRAFHVRCRMAAIHRTALPSLICLGVTRM